MTIQPVIQLQGIQKTYQMGENEVHALRHVDLEIYPGEFVAIMGPSGSGKSTLMNIIGCLDRPSGGVYTLHGKRVELMNSDQLADVRAETIGFVFQGFHLLSRTSTLENVELPMQYLRHRTISNRKEKAIRALETVGLGNRLDHVPSQLSGGQQQRVAIARALVNDPVLLLADEPTGNLDSKTSDEIMELFQSLNDKGITIVMVTHELDIAAHAKRTLVVKDGLIIQDQRRKDHA